jgi:hypothetical protein
MEIVRKISWHIKCLSWLFLIKVILLAVFMAVMLAFSGLSLAFPFLAVVIIIITTPNYYHENITSLTRYVDSKIRRYSNLEYLIISLLIQLLLVILPMAIIYGLLGEKGFVDNLLGFIAIMLWVLSFSSIISLITLDMPKLEQGLINGFILIPMVLPVVLLISHDLGLLAGMALLSALFAILLGEVILMKLSH